MIRLPASLLTLGPHDLVDYEERCQRRGREVENISKQFNRFDFQASKEPQYRVFRKLPTSSDEYVNACETFDNPPPEISYGHSLASVDGHEEPRHTSYGKLSLSENLLSVRLTITSPENLYQSSTHQQQSSSPSKDGFHYGGFIESTGSRGSSPFVPDDISTPQTWSHDATRAPVRTLPRSPLYFSHNASSSPEQRPTFSLTPRIASRIANHNTPGLLFSQSARRPATYRHQANSFSFDSSERSSTAYEQDRISSLSTTDTIPRPVPGLRLIDELRGSSLTSSRVSSTEEFIFSPPELALPPPFSTTSRRVSDALPSANVVNQPMEISTSRTGSSSLEHRQTSPMDFSLSSNAQSIQIDDQAHPNNQAQSGRNSATRSAGPGNRSSVTENPGSSPNGSGIRMNDFLRSSAARIVSFYRPPSPALVISPSGSRVLSMHSHHSLPQHLAVYNDALSPHTQPQTPAHLPESRHRSRYHPAYTAPVPRGAGRFGDDHARLSRAQTPHTPSRRSRVSPVGLQGAGFRGLYGGRENGDDEQSWVEGVRFSNAEVRLWGLRDAASESRTLEEEPEREDIRIRRH